MQALLTILLTTAIGTAIATAAASIVPTLPSAQKSSPSIPRLSASLHRELLLNGRPQVGLFRALLKESTSTLNNDHSLVQQHYQQQPFATPFSEDPSAPPTYQAYCHDQLVSHFDHTINRTFCQRYWVDASAYKPGGPVFVLDGGETDGADRLPFLQTGILQILSNATGGLSIVLEHRYYGESIPVPSFSTDDLRFLNNEEALEDSAHFIKYFNPPKPLGLETGLLRPNATPWFYYGGSYAGARAAHMRVTYPHLVWGAIASSAVTHAQVDFPQYYDPIQKYGPKECISTLQSAIQTIDSLLALPEPVPHALKSLFGLAELQDNGDFADVLSSPLGYWQAQNWDPKVSTSGFSTFCDVLTSGGASTNIGLIKIPAEVLNYASFVKKTIVSRCPTNVNDCFGTSDDEKFQDTDLSQTWRLWLFQVCTQWGYFQSAPTSGPSIVSSYLDLEHTSKICRQAYPPGKYFIVPMIPDVESVNARGDYKIESDRLAFIDGDRDPWRPMTPQSDWAPRRNSTVNRPMHIIFDAIHHYDENGLKDHDKEPPRIRDVHEFEKLFVQEWLAQWKEEKIMT